MKAPSPYNTPCHLYCRCGLVYLQTRHRWNERLLAVPETEVFELLQSQRRNLAVWLRGDNDGAGDDVDSAAAAATAGGVDAATQSVARPPRGATARARAELLEAVVRVTAGSGLRHGATATDESETRRWAAIEEDRAKRPAYTSARFTLSPRAGQPTPGDERLELVARDGRPIAPADERRRRRQAARKRRLRRQRSAPPFDEGAAAALANGDSDQDDSEDNDRDVAMDDDSAAAEDSDSAAAQGSNSAAAGSDQRGRGGESGGNAYKKATAQRIEIDLQAALLTIGSQHMRALEPAYAALPDVVRIFGTQAMQAASVESATHREWVRLVGRGHELQIWKSPDERAVAPHLRPAAAASTRRRT